MQIIRASVDFRFLLRITTLILLALTMSGCGLFGALYGVLIDPLIPRPKAPAEHDMSDKTVLIWIDDAFLAQSHHLLRREITYQLARKLQENRAVGSIVDDDGITRFRRAHPNYADMTIQQLGRQLQADEVLYVLIDKFQLYYQAGREFYQPQMSGYSKVIDVATGSRLWPQDQSHRPFTLASKLTQGQGPTFEDRQVKDLSEQLAEIIAPSFYEHRQTRNYDDNL